MNIGGRKDPSLLADGVWPCAHAGRGQQVFFPHGTSVSPLAMRQSAWPMGSIVMSANIGDQGLLRVLEQLCAIQSVTNEDLSDGRCVLTICHDNASREIEIALGTNDYGAQKSQYETLRLILTELRIEESAIYTPPPPPPRGMPPQIRAAREKQKEAFQAWQEVWRTIRKAEKALDVGYEIDQMKDYY